MAYVSFMNIAVGTKNSNGPKVFSSDLLPDWIGVTLPLFHLVGRIYQYLY